MSAVVSGMEHFRDNSSVQIAGLSLLSVAFAGGWWEWLVGVVSFNRSLVTLQNLKEDLSFCPSTPGVWTPL